jgi:hypothetical protein
MPSVYSDLDPKFWSKINTCIAPIHMHLDGIVNFIFDNAMIANFPQARC